MANTKQDRAFLMQAIFDRIESLTKPNTVVVAAEDEKGNQTKTKVVVDSLLEQLENAVQSTQLYGVKRGAALANTRNVLDLSALVLLGQISEELEVMRHEINDFRPRRPSLVEAVQQFYAHLQLAVQYQPDLPLEPILKTLGYWVNAINVKFDPPVVLDITRPCPECGADYVFDEYDDRHRAVVISWKKTFDKSRAECRACGQSWVGESELRQLRWDIDRRDDDTLDEG